MLTKTNLLHSLIVLLSFAQNLLAQEITIDGVFDDWQQNHVVTTDPVGDNAGAFDLSTVSAYSNGTILNLRFGIGKAINLQNGPEDEGTLQLELETSEKRLTIDFRDRTVTDGSKKHIGWTKIGFQCLPTFASNQYEIRIDTSVLGAKVGDNVKLQFAGSDSLDNPIEIQLRETITTPVQDQDWTKAKNSFRVVNQNTLQKGLADAERGPKFKRLFAAIDADVYCFQEEWKEADFQTGSANTLGSVAVHWNSACAIASRHKLVGLPMVLDRAAAGLITMDDGSKVVVISAHFKCCGFSGSKEDGLRVQQAEQLVGEITRLRDGAFGKEAQSAPVVLIGDYNLVGSRKPLDVINAAGLSDVICSSSNGSAFTWRGLKPDESFWPGRLDLVSTNGFQSVIGRVFDTAQLADSQLEQLALDKSDSLASDHLMLVVDCKLKE